MLLILNIFFVCIIIKMFKQIYNYICCIRYKEKQNNFTTLNKIWKTQQQQEQNYVNTV